MELTPGYKQTDAGVIPEDWNAVPLGRLALISAGGTPDRTNSRYWNGDIPWVTTTEINFNVIRETAQFITKDGLDNSAAKLLPEGTLLMALYGQGKTRGKVGILGITAATNQACAAIVLRDEVEQTYLFHFLVSRYKAIRELSNTGNQENLNNTIVRSIPVLLPPSEEQLAIATALSDVDALLEGLDRLIAKKRDLKQAAMQQLLTGQTRLPGFHERWEVKRLGDVATFHKGNGLPKSALSPYGSEPCVHYGELFTLYGETIRETISRTNMSPGAFRSLANDVLMPTSDVTPRGLAKASCVVSDDVVLGGDILVIRTDPLQISGTFLSHVIRREEDQVLRLVTGTTVFHLYGADMKKFTFARPPLHEQQAIVAVLSDMDVEIEALEERRAKSADLKQAMMQELLTGRTRLVEPPVSKSEDAAASQSGKGHNWAINEAVVIATLVKHFGSDNFPLGRKRYTKLAYLLHRYAERKADGYLKKAAGPYNAQTKYGGPEKIAKENGYIRDHKGPKGHSGFVAADNIAQAEGYFEKWYGSDVIGWLDQFRFSKNDDLEVLATVDMAVHELESAGKSADIAAVKDVIGSHPEWKAKLDRPVFSDAHIADAIEKSETLFGAGVPGGTHA